MKLEVFAVYDSKTEAHTRPWFAPTKGDAIRAFSDMINDITHPLGKHPEDYKLYLIANYDDKSGQIEKLQANKELVTGLDCVDKDYQDYLELKNNKQQAPTLLKEQAS